VRTLLAVHEQVFDHRWVEAAPSIEALAERVRPVTLAGDRTMAVLPPLAGLLPQGLPRGVLVAVGARPGVSGSMSLALMLAAGPSQAGAWVAVVGARSLGFAAAAELGVTLERLVVVDVGADPRRSRDRDSRRVHPASVVAALVDGFDVVLVGPQARADLHRGDTRRLEARVRERGGVLVGMGDDLPGGSAQVRMVVTASRWEGLEDVGHLRGCRATVEVTGRGAASRPRRAELRFPSGPGSGSGLSGRGDSERFAGFEVMANGSMSLMPRDGGNVRHRLAMDPAGA
jgi:hypothetical protein